MKKLLYSECIFLMKVLSKCNRKKQFANGEIAKGDKWGVGARGMVISFQDCHPGTNTIRSHIAFVITCAVRNLGLFRTQLCEGPAHSLIKSQPYYRVST